MLIFKHKNQTNRSLVIALLIEDDSRPFRRQSNVRFRSIDQILVRVRLCSFTEPNRTIGVRLVRLVTPGLVHYRGEPTLRFHIKLCKFLRNISKNILGKRTDLTLEKVFSFLLLFPVRLQYLDFFRFLLLLADDGENDL